MIEFFVYKSDEEIEDWTKSLSSVKHTCGRETRSRKLLSTCTTSSKFSTTSMIDK